MVTYLVNEYSSLGFTSRHREKLKYDRVMFGTDSMRCDEAVKYGQVTCSPGGPENSIGSLAIGRE